MRQRVFRPVEPVLDSHHRADVIRRARAADVGPYVRGKVAAGARADRLGERHRNTQRPHGIRFRLLLPRHREHAAVLTRLHQAGRDDRGRSTHRACGMDADQWLVGRPHCVGHEQLGHHDALEEVGRLADDDGIDVVERRSRVGQRAVDGLAHEAVHRHILALGDVLGLPRAQHRGELLGHQLLPFLFARALIGLP